MPVDPVPSDPPGAPVVFVTPHQDDEDLFMGQVIGHHAVAGREAHIVLGCNGALSNVIQKLNGTLVDANYWGGYHFPAREGYAPLSLQEFGLARTRELVASAAELGVPAGRVHLGRADEPLASSDLLPDAISVDWAKEIFESWADHFGALGFPQVSFYTMWWGDNHADHAALGQALRELRLADPDRYRNARWLVKPEQAAAAGASAYGLPADQAATIKAMAKHAGWCYRAWQPAAGAFAIGYHSVGTVYFPGVESGIPNHIVRP